MELPLGMSTAIGTGTTAGTTDWYRQVKVWGIWNGGTGSTLATTATTLPYTIDLDLIATGSTVTQNAAWATWPGNNATFEEPWSRRIVRARDAADIRREAAEYQERNRIARERRIRENYRRATLRSAAEVRARRLLCSMLNSKQQAELDDKGHFHVEVLGGLCRSKRVYRIERGMMGNVKLLDKNGKPTHSYCIHSDSRLPYEDHMLAQKLLLETDEKKFLKIANARQLH